MVAAAALLAEAPEQRGDVVSQDAAAVLDQEANELTHLRRETQHRLEDTNTFLSSLLFSENQTFLMLHISGDDVFLFRLRRYFRGKPAKAQDRLKRAAAKFPRRHVE